MAELPRFDGVVIHGMWMHAGLVAMQACMRSGVPYAYFPHGMLVLLGHKIACPIRCQKLGVS